MAATHDREPAATRFGRQPAYQLLHDERWPVTRAAERLGVVYAHLHGALIGRVRPRPEVIQGLAELLDAQPSELFTPEVLERPFYAHQVRGRRDGAR